jgi:hypothetical protein
MIMSRARHSERPAGDDHADWAQQSAPAGHNAKPGCEYCGVGEGVSRAEVLNNRSRAAGTNEQDAQPCGTRRMWYRTA